MPEENTQNVLELPDKVEYEFKCGIKAYQEEIDMEQEERLAAILEQVKIPNIEKISSMRLVEFVQLILSSKILPKIFDVVLIPTHIPENLKINKEQAASTNISKVDWKKLKHNEMMKVLYDFFTYSPGLLRLFGIGDAVLDMLRSLMTPANLTTSQE